MRKAISSRALNITVKLTEVISPHWDDAASPGVDWDFREGEVPCYVLGTSNHFPREQRDEGALGGRERRSTAVSWYVP